MNATRSGPAVAGRKQRKRPIRALRQNFQRSLLLYSCDYRRSSSHVEPPPNPSRKLNHARNPLASPREHAWGMLLMIGGT
ncbi:MAG: hypothetical protein WCS20_11025 [Alphaproteobacteria bacterium]